MPTPAPPGIYTEETSVPPAPIERLARDAALFVGSLSDEAGDALLGPFTDPAGFEQLAVDVRDAALAIRAQSRRPEGVVDGGLGQGQRGVAPGRPNAGRGLGRRA